MCAATALPKRGSGLGSYQPCLRRFGTRNEQEKKAHARLLVYPDRVCVGYESLTFGHQEEGR